MADEEKGPVILDNGSGVMKAGFGGQESPHVLFATVYGTAIKESTPPASKKDDVTSNNDNNDEKESSSNNDNTNKSENDTQTTLTFIGNDVRKKSDKDTIICPINKGIIEDWEIMEKLWNHTYMHELRIESEEHSVVLT